MSPQAAYSNAVRPCHASSTPSPLPSSARRMYHLLRGFHEYLTRKDEFSIVIIGLDNVSPSPLAFRLAFVTDGAS